jgi:hypothetical protein
VVSRPLPARAKEPSRYWLCTLPKNTKKAYLIQACKRTVAALL